jgi:hypothetical protein
MREAPSETTSSARHARVIALAITGCVVAIAARGSSSRSTTAPGSPPLAASLRFAACMRSHGVPSFIDRTSDGRASPVRQVAKHSPAFHTAQQACQSLQAELADAKPRPSRAGQPHEAECMRAHGVTRYPDQLPGGGSSIPSTINPQAPAFIAAARACGKR